MRDPGAAEPAICVMVGARGRVIDEIERRASPGARLAWLGGGSAAAPAWHGTRQLFGFAADVLSPGAFEVIVARHRAIVAALWPERAIALSEPEQATRDELCADPRSLHTHSTASWQPLISAVARWIVDVLEATGAIAAVPELASLDAQTGHALVEVFRGRRGQLAGLLIGHDPARVVAPIVEWGVPVTWSLAQVREQLADYQMGPGVALVWLAGASDATAPAGPRNAWSAWSPEAVALEALAGATPPSHAALLAGMSALRWASEVYASGAAFRIGVMLDPHRARLDRAAQAEHAALTAIAATNSHFVDVATPGFDAPLYAMYERAIALATDPIAVAALAVRRAFAGVDRAEPDVEGPLARATSAVRAVADDPWAAYYAAWLALTAALHELHGQDLAAAEQLAQAACTRFVEAAEQAAAVWSAGLAERFAREAACARFLVLSHGALAAAGVADASAARWWMRAEHERPRVPVICAFEVLHWTQLRPPGGHEDLAVLLERCRAGIRDAECYWMSRSWPLYRSIAAECAYRMGQPAEAAEHCLAVLDRRATSIEEPAPAWLGGIRSLALRALLRAGDHAAVLALAQRRLADPAEPAPAEVQAVVAWMYARQGDRASAAAAIERAIDEAVASGQHATMLRVATAAARVLGLVDDRAEASQALDSAWGLAVEDDGAWCEAARPEDRLRLCVVHARVAGVTGEILARACAVLPAALEVAEGWWDATDLLEAITEWHRRGEVMSDEIRAGVRVMRERARDRAGWQAQLDELP